MKKKDKKEVCERVDAEGFDYAFRYYSSFEEVKDPKFHQLREAYKKAAEDLEAYIGWPEYEKAQEEGE